ncbi:G-protein coupled receptor 55-like [Amblyraja radiata]|uniref:G-protein coupled receptor 55-like n=1 Tax=Amblyraja radiata TaxID=386614 RepID=UPI001402CC1E|nr:G-protein coupled receptor 55-like [Amblyraja radiata]
MCSRNNTTDSEFVKTFQYVVHIPTFALGLVINLTALWILCFRLKNWTESMIYMTNLIFSDLLLLFSLPFKMHAFQKSGEWHLGHRFCQFVESLYFVNTYGTILLIMLISLDRYIAIRYPILARTLRSPKKAAIACTVLWLCVWSASIPNYLRTGDRQKKTCFSHFATFWEGLTIPLIMLTIFVISAAAVIFCSVRILKTLRRVDEEREEINTRTSMHTISCNLATFLLCFTPYHVAMLLYLLARKCYMPVEYQAPLRVFLQVSQCLATTNCCLDVMYYYLIIKEFWKSKIMSTLETLSSNSG